MSDLEEKLLDSLYSRIRPIISIYRVTEVIFLLLMFSPKLSVGLIKNAFLAALPTGILILKDIFLSIEFWKFVAVIVGVFFMIPILSAVTNGLLFRYVHRRLGANLIDNVTKLYARDFVVTQHEDNLVDLYNKKKQSLKKISGYKALGEAMLIIVLVCAFLSPTPLSITLGFTGVVYIVSSYWISRQIFLLFMRDVKPFDVLQSRISATKFEAK